MTQRIAAATAAGAGDDEVRESPASPTAEPSAAAELSADYRVGYRKPPVHTRFAPGRSGTPQGRPKGARNMASALEHELRSKVVITENGRRRSITKLEAAVKQLVNKAASGDPRSLQFLFTLAQSSPAAEPGAGPLSAEVDAQVRRDLLNRMKKLIKDTPHE